MGVGDTQKLFFGTTSIALSIKLNFFQKNIIYHICSLLSTIPLKKKDEQELKDLGYEFLRYGKNHKVYKHKTIKYPYEGHQTIVSQGTYDFGSYLKMLKATVKYSMDAMDKEKN